jgi:two-component system chemotaxis sensor kinase CheA
MTYEDKKSYLYEDLHQTTARRSRSLNLFIDTQKSTIENLFDIYNHDPIAIKSNIKRFITSELINIRELDLNSSDLDQESSYLYRNEKVYNEREPKKISNIPYKEIKSLSPKYRIKNQSGFIYTKNQNPTRYLIVQYLNNGSNTLIFEYLVSPSLNNIFSQGQHQTTIFGQDTGLVYTNKPNLHHPKFEKFFLETIKGLTKRNNKNHVGTIEAKLGGTSYIISFKNLKSLPGLYTFTHIETTKAYLVTEKLIINTIFVALALIGIFNILTLYMARVIITPLTRLNSVIKAISGKNYTGRLEEQKFTELDNVATSFNAMIEKISDYHQQLEDYNKNLEIKVEERTLDLEKANEFIKAMINSLDQGLLVFNQEGVVLPTYTKSCEDFFQKSISQKNLVDLINPPKPDVFKKWINMAFEEKIAFKSIANLAIKNLPYITDDVEALDFKHISLQFFPIRDSSEKIIYIVLVATDETLIIRSSKRLEAQQSQVQFISKVVKNRANFIRFKLLIKKIISEEMVFLKNNEYRQGDVLRLLHSVKGTASFYNLTIFTQFVHDLETELSNNESSPQKVFEKLEDLQQKFEEEILPIRDIWNDSNDEIKMTSVTQESIEDMKVLIDAQKDLNLSKEYFKHFLSVPAESYIEQYKELVSELSKKLGKKMHPLKIEGGDIRVQGDYFQKFFDSCIHLFRNALDHAIEKPKEREASKKDAQGLLEISFKMIEGQNGGMFVFTVKDNGRGIDPSKIREKMSELGYADDALELPDDKIIYSIFG